MVRGTGGPFDTDQLLSEFVRYDRDVDIVSAYHWLFTETEQLPGTVTHFERYPRIAAADGKDATPDFTVLYEDGTGLVAEIANLALHENSVEKLCRQLCRYSSLTALPGKRRKLAKVEQVDVIYLVPMAIAADAARRILIERLDNPNHEFTAARRPTIVQFARESDRYIFQFWAGKENGELILGSRDPNYAKFGTLSIRPEFFNANKVQHAFMNDPVPPLYMATRLWSSVFPSSFTVGARIEFETTTSEITGLLKSQYGHGKADDVRAAMQILVAADLATDIDGRARNWKVHRRNLRRVGADVHEAIAHRIDSTSSGSLGTRRTRQSYQPHPAQGSLFEL